ncbi:MAG: NAD(P)H-hydrate dehydratase [Clostridia bacterium]|nr:NAD(P)H-hydrate dehydratase [Clostridia bacterium]
MKLARSELITEIDAYAQNTLGVSVMTLMERSGEAVASVVRHRVKEGGRVVILAGKGNNGGDGYATAIKLMDAYDVKVIDVFGEGQRTEEGKHFLNEFKRLGGNYEILELTDAKKQEIRTAECIVDAIFGTGFRGEIPEIVKQLSVIISESLGAEKIAIDVPIGVDADDGSVEHCAFSATATVELCFIKPGIVSYPARSFVGEIIFDDLGLPRATIREHFKDRLRYALIDSKWAAETLPLRESNSNKGSFGKLLMITGSKRFRGAGRLSLSAALRGGVGLVTYVGDPVLVHDFSAEYPEAVYKAMTLGDEITEDTISEIAELSAKHSATLIGSGSDNTDGLAALTRRLLATEGGPLILDADAINVLAQNAEEGRAAIKAAKRKVILTPHPLEFARLSGLDVAYVQLNRMEVAIDFAKEHNCTLVLKGAGTLVTDGDYVFVNKSGSSALAKAGSGDVLAGLLGALASFIGNANEAAALAAFFHGKAADALAKELSTFGVTPSDLPLAIAKQVAKIEKRQKNTKKKI